MTEPYEPLTPTEIEQKLRGLVNSMTRAERLLREARDEETDKELLYRAAHRRAMLSDKCPVVSRSGVTTAYRDAWVDEQCSVELRDYKLAQAKCEAAKDHVRTQRDVVSAVQTLAQLWKTAFSVAGQT